MTEVDRFSASVSVPNANKWALMVDICFGWKQLHHIQSTFGFGGLQMVNLVVAESRSQSLSCGGQSASLASLWTDYVMITEEAWLHCLRLVLWALALMATLYGSQGGVRVKDIRCMASGATDDRHSDLLASIAVSAQTLVSVFSRKSCFTFGADYELWLKVLRHLGLIRFLPKVKFPLLFNL